MNLIWIQLFFNNFDREIQNTNFWNTLHRLLYTVSCRQIRQRPIYHTKGFIFVQIHFLAAVKTARLSLIGLHPFGVALPVWFSWSPAAFFAHPPTLSFELFASLVTVRATMYSHSLSISRDFFLRFWSSLFWILLSEFKRLTASVDFIISGLPENITGAEKRKNHLVNWFWTSGPIMLKPSR